jgi:hypothetical protein
VDLCIVLFSANTAEFKYLDQFVGESCTNDRITVPMDPMALSTCAVVACLCGVPNVALILKNANKSFNKFDRLDGALSR